MPYDGFSALDKRTHQFLSAPKMRGIAAAQVYEYLDSDLECLIRDRATVISAADVKSYMAMVLRSLAACRAAWVLHRDVKPSNFLISMSGARVPVQAPLQCALGSCFHPPPATCLTFLSERLRPPACMSVEGHLGMTRHFAELEPGMTLTAWIQATSQWYGPMIVLSLCCTQHLHSGFSVWKPGHCMQGR